MGTILFNAFSFLQKQLKEKNIPCTNARVPFSEGQRVKDVLRNMNIRDEEIEGVFVNGKIAPADTLLNDGDRVAAFPPGTPGPYRLLLGIVKKVPDSLGKKQNEG
ncbi:MAG: MoaD/ThiS family protein [Desulfobacteraceae bacterium]|nr:MAG: MoaD/ThiS family protein [Desulfobacteraceae bacterium]